MEHEVNQPSMGDRFIVVVWHGAGSTVSYIVEQMELEELWEVAACYVNDRYGAAQACSDMNAQWNANRRLAKGTK